MSDIKYALYTSSKGFKVVGGTAAQFLKADGSVDNTLYITTNSEINMGDKNLNFTTGAISKFDGSTRVFNKVFQKYNGTPPTGMASFKFPQATASATMFDVTIKIHLWNIKTLATFRIAFYKNSATQIQPAYHKAMVECNDNFPATAVNVGIDATGNVCINIGDATTVWGTHVMFEVERVVSFYSGANYDWSKGWFLTSETDISSYQSLVNITPEIIATRNWVSANIISSNSGQTDLSGNKTTSGDWTFNGSSASHISLLRPGQTINNSIGFGFDTLSQYIGLADNTTFAIGNNLNLQSLSFRKFWVDFTKNSVNAAGQTGGSMLGSKDNGGFTITTSTDSNRAEMILRHIWTANNRTYGVGGVSASASGSMANWGMWQWFNDRSVNGHDGFIGFIGNKDEVMISSLAGTGSRMVVANGNGVISTQAIPNLSNYYTQNESLNLFVGKSGTETINDTKTFTSSPVIPNGILGTHAVNKNQLELTAGNEVEGGQPLKINGNNSVTITNFFVTSRDGSRNPNDIAPNSTPRRVRFDFAAATAAGLGGSGNYAGIMTYSPWDGTTASTGDSSYQLAFANQTGADGSGIPMLKIRKGINGNWATSWYKFWTQADFTITNIQQWNDAFQNGLRLNQDFTIFTGNEVMISDNYFANESGLIDANYKNSIACKVNEYYKFGSNIHGGWEGINYHYEKQTLGIGAEADSDNKVRVEGCVKAIANFKSKEESPDSIFIPDGSIADLKDEIVNEKYAIRLDPHEYELDPSGYLDVDDRNRLIHIIGEQIKMAVNFKEIYPKQQIVIYNFDQNGYPMAVLIKGKPVYNIEPGCFLRLYVTKSLRVIAERQQPCEFIW